MEQIEIKKLTIVDLDSLQQISKQTFHETFAAVNTEQNMAKYLEEEFSIEKLTAELNNPDSEFYFALLDSKPVGYIKLNYRHAQTELKDNKGLEIERIYVLHECQGKKIGQVLYEVALQMAEKESAEYVWLGVWEENLKAISFYLKNGFVEFDKHAFLLGDDKQTDIMMKKIVK